MSTPEQCSDFKADIRQLQQRQETQGERLGELIEESKEFVKSHDFERIDKRTGRIENALFVIILFLVAIFGKEYLTLFSKL